MGTICSSAGRGDDLLRGGDGDQRVHTRGLYAGPGEDRAFGGRGRRRGDRRFGPRLPVGGNASTCDRIFADKDGQPDEVHCGEGDDIAFADNNDNVANDCEEIA